MKKIDNHIDELFEEARKASPETSAEWVQQHLKSGGAVAQGAVLIKSVIFFVAAVSVFVAVWTYLPSNEPETAEKPIEVKKQEVHSSDAIALQSNADQLLNIPEEIKIKQEPVIPEIYKHDVSEEIHSTNIITEPIAVKDVTQPIMPACTDSSYNYRKLNIEAIHLTELSDADLLKLGITETEKGIRIPLAGGRLFATITPTLTQLEFKSTKVLTTGPEELSRLENQRSATLPSTSLSKPIYPEISLVTDSRAQAWRLFQLNEVSVEKSQLDSMKNTLTADEYEERRKAISKQDEIKLASKASSFVPVLVKCRKCKPGVNGDIIIWFEPGQALFNALPALLSENLCEEYRQLFVEKKKTEGSCTFYEACKDKPGAILNLNVFPNPVDKAFDYAIELDAERIIQAGLYSINGVLQRTLLIDKTCEAGRNEFSADVSEMPPGIYLLVIETEKSEIRSLRLIKK